MKTRERFEQWVKLWLPKPDLTRCSFLGNYMNERIEHYWQGFQAGAGGWKTIEGALKDGSNILIFDSSNGWMIQGHWSAQHKKWCALDWSSDEFPTNGPIEPTRYRPLPDPPEKEGK